MDVNLSLIWQNEDWLVVDKPTGWLTVPSRNSESDPRPCLGTRLQKSLGQQLWPIHRLDFEVSGLVLFAKSAAAHRAANGWFEGRLVQKTYEALSLGPVGAEFMRPQTWHSRMKRGKRRAFVAPGGLEAETLAVCQGPHPKRPDYFTWQLNPLTGRPHQLRVEMYHRGFPILGDTLYSGATWAQTGIALRAVALDFGKIKVEERIGLSQTFSVDHIPLM